MPVGNSGVENYTNTTSANAIEVVATGDLGDAGVVAQYQSISPIFIVTDSGSFLTTDSGLFLVV